MTRIDWLPDMVYLHTFRGDESQFIKTLYTYFTEDFIQSSPCFRQTRLGLKRLPLRNGKEATFYHMTTCGHDEDNRELEPKRCERLRWARPVIECEEFSNSSDVKIWKSKRKGETRINLWLEEANYFVVLAQRKGYILPWTAFCIEYKHQKLKKQREFERYQKRPW